MPSKNPYLTDEHSQDSLDTTAGFIKGAEVVWNTRSALVSTFAVVGANARGALLNLIPGVNINTSTVAAAEAEKATSGLLDIGGVGIAMGSLVFGARALQAVGEMAHGDNVKATGKLVRGVAEAGVVVLHVSGLLWFAEVLSKLVTGKFISTHVGDAAENMAVELMKSTAEQEARQPLHNIHTAPNHVAVATIPGGIEAAGLTANNMMQAGATSQLTMGGLPSENKLHIKGSQVLPMQVVPATYDRARAVAVEEVKNAEHATPKLGMKADHWRMMVDAKNGKALAGGQEPIIVNSGDPRFGPTAHADALAFARQNTQLTTNGKGA